MLRPGSTHVPPAWALSENMVVNGFSRGGGKCNTPNGTNPKAGSAGWIQSCVQTGLCSALSVFRVGFLSKYLNPVGDPSYHTALQLCIWCVHDDSAALR